MHPREVLLCLQADTEWEWAKRLLLPEEKGVATEDVSAAAFKMIPAVVEKQVAGTAAHLGKPWSSIKVVFMTL